MYYVLHYLMYYPEISFFSIFLKEKRKKKKNFYLNYFNFNGIIKYQKIFSNNFLKTSFVLPKIFPIFLIFKYFFSNLQNFQDLKKKK